MPPDALIPRVAATATALPPHYASQDDILATLRDYWGAAHFNVDRLEDLHRSTQVMGRHLALPLADYPALDSFAKRNDAWIRVATDLAEQAAADALRSAGLVPADIDHLFFVSTTGVATPGIDARLVNRLGFRPNVKRTPLFGLGCVAGAAGIARAADYLRAFPGQRALLVSVELCSLTMQHADTSMANIIASGLFGDGAAAAILSADDGPGPRVVATDAVFYPGTELIMGWDVIDSGFKLMLSPQVPVMAREHVGGDVARFLATHGLTRQDIAQWVAHTGGPKVLEAFQEALDLPAGALDRSWESLRAVGNLSSASVLFVLDDLLRSGTARPGDRGMLLAMGPGFCTEMALLQW
ncbi:MAG: 3-oxoacyl-[acyl-carrier-protein] synthase III C-terminal domain-containing protein [Gemmatimonadaceae bacterium]|nr:3-oxoacyl-[acyl-carrier-protein] synthase III C-terminal domain-containing protein [Gemmatimonadaceae bacterium]